MHRVIASFVVALSLVGCAHYAPSMPADYAGPRATVKDSVKIHSPRKADFFHVSHVDEREVENSRLKTQRLNRGRGMNMIPALVQNTVAAKATALRVVARTEYAAPILTMVGTVYQVNGIVEFTPEADKTYTVRGELGENYSAVWIEDDESHVVVGKKVEIKGSAKVGALDK